jgi:hypothetical protein
MLQQVIAIIIILFFVLRLMGQKKKKEINGKEFSLWFIFWLLAAVAIIFIRSIDRLVADLGFSGSGINFLIYLAVLGLFYLVLRLRIDLEKLDKNLTDVARLVALKNKDKD